MRRKVKVYLDTSVISARFDKRIPEMQFLTERFFQNIENFDTYVSELVFVEIGRTKNARLRNNLRKLASSFNILPIDEESRALADEYIRHGAVPEDYPEDALHIAIASVNGMDYLLSWNFEHLVKVKTRRIVSMVNTSLGYPYIDIVTPAEVI
jgi:predicted nucleic acid-binding protein